MPFYSILKDIFPLAKNSFYLLKYPQSTDDWRSYRNEEAKTGSGENREGF